MNPTKKVRDLCQYKPKKPKTGWRVWREASFHSDIAAGEWCVELWLDGKLIKRGTSATNYGARMFIFKELERLGDKEKKKIRLHEAFNEAE